MDASQYNIDELLRDGFSVKIRAIRPTDKAALRAGFKRLSPETTYFRFMGSRGALLERELDSSTEIDFRRHVSLVASSMEPGGERIVGVARYICPPHGPCERAEIAVTVEDAFQGRGVGTLLLEHLALVARAQGVTSFEADVLGSNVRMLAMMAQSGFSLERSVSGGVFHFSFPTTETLHSQEAHRNREREATVNSLHAFFEPRSIAIVGASRRPGSVSHSLLKNILQAGFPRDVFLVNPHADGVLGKPCFSSLSAIGKPVELAFITVPAAAVEAAVKECAKSGVRAVVIITAGFAEMGEEGKERERRLAEFVRASGMRLVGPNCLGVLSTGVDAPLHGTFAGGFPPAGNIGVLTQSGAVGIVLLDHLRRLQLGISSFVSIGNRADVSPNDLLQYWENDPRTAVIALYLESFGNSRKFAQLAMEVGRKKPIVVLKSGTTTAGARAASSHSAALAGSDVAAVALFKQAGLIQAHTLQELLDLAAFFSRQSAPRGRGVGVVTNAGGPGILFADAAESHHLVLPELCTESKRALRTFLPPTASVANPVDVIASAGADQFEQALEVVGRDPAVDSVAAIVVVTPANTPAESALAIARGAGKIPAEKPLVCAFMDPEGVPVELFDGPRGLLPNYQFPEAAAHVLANAAGRWDWLHRPSGACAELSPLARDCIRAVIGRTLEGATGPVWLSPLDFAAVLEAAGIDFAATERCLPSEVPEVATRVGFPLVAKAVAPGILHKSDVGGVVLNIRSTDDASRAARDIEAAIQQAGKKLEGILLQREIKEGIEVLVGVTEDPVFGPLVLCGWGGTSTEVLHDVSPRLPPVTDRDALEMISELRISKLLAGFRGAPPGDVDALVGVIQRISALVSAVPEILELDLNPVKVLPPGRGAVVVDGRIKVGRVR